MPPNGLPGIPCGDGSHYLPKTVAIACADNGIRAVNLVWHGWTVQRAIASGTYQENDCSPTCLGGHLRSYLGADFEFIGPIYDNQFSTVLVTFKPGHAGPHGQTSLLRRL